MGLKSALSQFTRSLRDPELTKLELRSDPLNNPSIPLSSAGFLAWALAGEPTASGEQVTVATALQQITVYACVRVLAESVASLPMKVYERLDRGKSEAFDHPLAYLLSTAPNDEMTAVTFWESIVGSLALEGNGYAEIQRDAGGRVMALWPLNPQKTTPKRNAAGTLVYETTDGMTSDKTRVISSANMLHVPLFSFDGLKGISPIQMARQGIGLARASEKYGARFFGNGSRPGGVLSTPSDLTDEELAAVKETWLQTQSGDKQGSTAVLPGDWKYAPLGLSPEDSQFLQTRQFQRTEIAALFRVPPHMVGDTARLSNNNHEQQGLSFVTDTLRPYLCRIEAEVARKLLPTAGRNSGKYFIRFDVSERLRGDFKTTMDGYAVGKQWGFLSTNDVREDLDMNPIGPEGDIYWAPVNMQNSEWLLETESIQDQPIGADPNAPTDPVKPTEPEKKSLGRYTRSFISVYRDAFGRLSIRNKRDYETISTLFKPVLRSIANVAIEDSQASELPADHIIDDVLRAMEKRATKWPATIAETDLEAVVQSEFIKTVRSIHINLAKEIAAAKAIGDLAPESNEQQ
jgi:HK97 family phage portal protein